MATRMNHPSDPCTSRLPGPPVSSISGPHGPGRGMLSLLTVATVLALVVPISLTTGCAATGSPKEKAKPAERVFYPPPPAPPRIQYLTTLRQPRAWESTRREGFAQWIAGHARQAPEAAGRFISPYGMAVDQGRLYVCDVGGSRVHVIDLVRREYRTLGGTEIITPVNITIADDGRRYVCDTGLNKVLVFDAEDRFVTHFAGPEGWRPIDLAIRGDELYVADIRGGTIHVLDREGRPLRTISERGRGPDQLHGPTNLTFGPNGLLHVTDTYRQTVKLFDTEGRFRGAIGGPGSALGRFARPKGIAIDEHGHIYVADSQWEVVQIFDPRGRLLLVFGGGGDPSLKHTMGMPAGLLIDRESIEHFREHIDPAFEAEYLLFVINQFGVNKIAVYAFGQARDETAFEQVEATADRPE